jgi:hypothetical protein
MFKFTLLAGLIAVTFCASSATEGADADGQFEKLAARFVDTYPALGPVGATQLGDHRFDDRLALQNGGFRSTI